MGIFVSSGFRNLSPVMPFKLNTSAADVSLDVHQTVEQPEEGTEGSPPLGA